MFNTAFPYYLSLGCSYDEFWNKPSWVVVAYREAEIQRQERVNYESWLQGLYMYTGIKSAIDTFAWGFGGKKGAKPPAYPDRRFAFTDREKEADRQIRIAESLKFFREGQNQ